MRRRRRRSNDVSKVVRAIEVSLAARQPLTEQWRQGRDALVGYKILRLGLAPERARLYERINERAAGMFARGLVEETERLVERYGFECRPLGSLGYAEAVGMLRGEWSQEEAVRLAQQGHRNYAKRQETWFRRETGMHWLRGVGGDEAVVAEALRLVREHLADF
jgi:tRNA dimethylallyltransferase